MRWCVTLMSNRNNVACSELPANSTRKWCCGQGVPHTVKEASIWRRQGFCDMAGFEQPTENHFENSSKNLPTSSLYVNWGFKQWLPCSIPVARDCVPKITAVMHFLL